MTVANIQGITSASSQLGNTATKADADNKVSFSSVMNQAGYQKPDTTHTVADRTSSKQEQSTTGKKDDIAQKDTSSYSKAVKDAKQTVKDANQVKDTKNAKMDSVSDNNIEDIDDIATEVNDAVNQIAQLLMQMLGIDEQQLSEGLQQLNMTPVDLLNGDNVLQLIMQQTDSESMMDIFNNEDLASLVKDVMAQINAIKEEHPVLQQMEPAMIQQVSKEVMVEPEAENIVSEPDEMQVQNEFIDGVKVVTQTQQNASMSQDSEQSHDMSQPKQPTTQNDVSDSNMVFNNLTEAVAKTDTVAFSNTTQAVDVVSQVVEEIKTVVKQTTTTMELQLNPENLGKVHIQVTSKEGVLTAQITAQTEAAKHAMESQLSTLKEAFQNQGLKVEAVEVAINPHGFQDMNQQQFDNQQQQASKSKKQIRLEDLDADEEQDLTEEEAIAVDMMRQEGNQVNFTA